MKTIEASARLKSLNTRKTILESELSELRKTVDSVSDDIRQKQNQIGSINHEIKTLVESQKDPIVSEHAIVRYFERVLGFDIEKIKSEILTSKIVTCYHRVGNGTFPLDAGDGCAVIKSGIVVTIK